MRSIRRRPLRRGFTLIELLAVMAVFSVTMTIIVMTLHGLQKRAIAIADQPEHRRPTRSLRAPAANRCPCWQQTCRHSAGRDNAGALPQRCCC